MSYRHQRANRDRNQGPIVKALQRCGVFVIDLTGVGGGCPDLLCYRRSTGLLRLLEVKNPETGGDLSASQRKHARRVPTWVVRDKAEALAAMEVERARP